MAISVQKSHRKREIYTNETTRPFSHETPHNTTPPLTKMSHWDRPFSNPLSVMYQQNALTTVAYGLCCKAMNPEEQELGYVSTEDLKRLLKLHEHLHRIDEGYMAYQLLRCAINEVNWEWIARQLNSGTRLFTMKDLLEDAKDKAERTECSESSSDSSANEESEKPKKKKKRKTDTDSEEPSKKKKKTK